MEGLTLFHRLRADRHNPLPAWDPRDPAVRVDPYPLYRALVERRPMYRSDWGPWIVSGYDDCATIYRHPATSSDFRNWPAWDPADNPEAPAMSFLFLDPPDHTRLRGLVSRAFAPRRVEVLREQAQQFVDDTFDRAEGAGGMEVVGAIARPLPLLLVCQMLGIPIEDGAQISQWTSASARDLDPVPTLPPDHERTVRAAEGQARAYLRALLARRRDEPSAGLLPSLAEIEDQSDKLTENELVKLLYLLLVAGQETTRNMLSNGVLAFARHPDQLERLRDDPSLDKGAVEEVMRFDPPVHTVARVPMGDIELSGGTVPRLQGLITLPAAASRDPSQFSDPEIFDIGRADNRHLGFGFGMHSCIGAALARLQGQVVFSTLARRFRKVELVRDPPAYKENITLRGVSSLDVKLKP